MSLVRIMARGSNILSPRPLPVILSILICISIFISLIITVILVLLETKIERSDHYVGAVVEFAPTESDAFETPKEVSLVRNKVNLTYRIYLHSKVLVFNMDKYLAFMTEAGEAGADIIVFPEYGLSGVGVSNLGEDRERARQFMVVGKVGRSGNVT